MLASLLQLAQDSSSDKRRELLGRLADLFYGGGRDALAEQQLQMFATVVTRLLRDIDETGRAAFAARVAASPSTPKRIALALAVDTTRVSTPVLELSPVLDDDDLSEIASTRGTDQRLAISRRETVTERVSDTLLSFDELEVMQSLLDSPGAAISEPGFERIANRADTTNGLREKICLRGDAPVALAIRLIPYLGSAERAKLRQLMQGDTNRLGLLVRDALPMVSYERVNRAKRRLQIKHMAALVQEGRLSVDGFVDDLMAERRPLDVALGLAELSQLTEKHVANAILSVSPEPLALVAKALGLSAEVYERVDQLRRAGMKLPSEPDAALLTNYAAIDLEQAQRALRFVRVRGAVAAS